jgi:hypothetical protein
MPSRLSTPVLAGLAFVVVIPLFHLTLSLGLLSAQTFQLIDSFRSYDRGGLLHQPRVTQQDELLVSFIYRSRHSLTPVHSR